MERKTRNSDQPRPQGFSLIPAPPIFWGKSPGDEAELWCVIKVSWKLEKQTNFLFNQERS